MQGIMNGEVMGSMRESEMREIMLLLQVLPSAIIIPKALYPTRSFT